MAAALFSESVSDDEKSRIAGKILFESGLEGNSDVDIVNTIFCCLCSSAAFLTEFVIRESDIICRLMFLSLIVAKNCS